MDEQPEFHLRNCIVTFDGDGFGEEAEGIVVATMDDGARFMVMTNTSQLRVVGIEDCYVFNPPPPSLIEYLRTGRHETFARAFNSARRPR